MTIESQAAFARRMKGHLGRAVHPSTVSRWADSGRLVMIDGKVDVEASLALLSGTQGDRQDVADRHAQEAEQKTAAESSMQPNSTPDFSMEEARRVRAVAEARIKAAEAEIREMERDRESGRLIEKDVVDFVLQDFGAVLRGQMETLADRLAPIVFPLQSFEETHAALDEAAESVLVEMAETIKRRAAETQGRP